MEVFEVVIALLLAGAGLAAPARRVGTPYPALLFHRIEEELDWAEFDTESLLRTAESS